MRGHEKICRVYGSDGRAWQRLTWHQQWVQIPAPAMLQAMLPGALTNTGAKQNFTITWRTTLESDVPQDELDVPARSSVLMLMPEGLNSPERWVQVWLEDPDKPPVIHSRLVEKDVPGRLREILLDPADLSRRLKPTDRRDVWVRGGWSAAQLHPELFPERPKRLPVIAQNVRSFLEAHAAVEAEKEDKAKRAANRERLEQVEEQSRREHVAEVDKREKAAARERAVEARIREEVEGRTW